MAFLSKQQRRPENGFEALQASCRRVSKTFSRLLEYSEKHRTGVPQYSFIGSRWIAKVITEQFGQRLLTLPFIRVRRNGAATL